MATSALFTTGVGSSVRRRSLAVTGSSADTSRATARPDVASTVFAAYSALIRTTRSENGYLLGLASEYGDIRSVHPAMLAERNERST